jgi:hypothetical protein
MDKGSGSRIFGSLMMGVSGIIALINFGAIAQTPGSSFNNVTYLFNLIFIAAPIALVGFFIYLAGRRQGSEDKGSEFAKKQDKIRPLL